MVQSNLPLRERRSPERPERAPLDARKVGINTIEVPRPIGRRRFSFLTKAKLREHQLPQPNLSAIQASVCRLKDAQSNLRC